jgi:hypothetical protein
MRRGGDDEPPWHKKTKGKPKAAAFQASSRTVEKTVDEADSTKLAKKKSKATKGGLGGGISGGLFGGIGFSADKDDDDDDASDDDVAATDLFDDADDDKPNVSTSASWTPSAWAPARLAADLREGGELPGGLALVDAMGSAAGGGASGGGDAPGGGAPGGGEGGKGRLVEGEDGAWSLPLRAREHLVVRMGREHGLTSWELEACRRLAYRFSFARPPGARRRSDARACVELCLCFDTPVQTQSHYV